MPGTYQVWADFGEGLADTGLRTVVNSATQVKVSCSVAQKRCFASP
jgi:hypothetical protein